MKSFLESLIVSVLAIFAPIKATLIAAAFLIVSDMVSGVYAAYKRGEKITSANLRRSLSKFILFEFAMIAAFVTEKYLLDGSIPACKLVGSLVGLTELKSIYENLSEISGNDFFKVLLSKIGSENAKKLD